jgi:uncharacterized membrane protein
MLYILTNLLHINIFMLYILTNLLHIKMKVKMIINNLTNLTSSNVNNVWPNKNEDIKLVHTTRFWNNLLHVQ